MSRAEIVKVLDEKLDVFDKISAEWDEFLKKNTYLTYPEKERFQLKLNENSKYLKFPWYSFLFFRIMREFRNLRRKVDMFLEEINDYNIDFIRRRKRIHNSFFQGKDDSLEYRLDAEQIDAIIKDDKHNLIVAAAGSGKTSVIAARIAYLTRRKDIVKRERILAIAFTKVAAQEMKERVKKNYGIDMEIRTFHALGRKILDDETGKKPKLLFNQNFDYEQYKLITNLFEDCLKSKEFQDILVEYYAYHIEQELEEDSFLDKEEYYLYMKNKKYRTLNNIEVKSLAEADIANFFFIHNIDFEYEPNVEWIDHDHSSKENEDKEYHPDFYLPENDVYIEHWGLNEKYEVAPWFDKTSEEYLQLREWKLDQFRRHGKKLIETWDYERSRDILISNLRIHLEEIIPGIQFNQLSYEELVEKTHSFKEKRNEVTNLIASFIKIAKSNFYFPKDIEQRLSAEKFTKKQQIFSKIALEVYKSYQDYLKNEDKIDFNDMINIAVEYIAKNPIKYANMYDQVLVDEFQDISYQRLQLIKGFVNSHSATKLFCVGDDFQSIYQFTGSNVQYFSNFEEYFDHPEISYLSINYRSTESIIRMSNDLISRNKNQIQKQVIAYNKAELQPIFFDLSREYRFGFKSRIPHVYQLIKSLIDEGVKPKDIMVLSRFNNFIYELEQYCGTRAIPTEYKAGGIRFYSAHKSKGTESKHIILADVTSGLYGFPCEIQDSSVLEVVKRFRKQRYIEEERRLFYVALTRSKQFLYIFSLEGENSVFVNEIQNHLEKICIDRDSRWETLQSDYIPAYLEGHKPKDSVICPKCGKFLIKKKGRYGEYVRCSGFPKCDYLIDIFGSDDTACPRCGRKLIVRSKTYGKVRVCLQNPNCDYIEDIFEPGDKSCPQCGRKLVVKNGKYGKFLGCVAYPNCEYKWDILDKNEVPCPYCESRLVIRTGPYGSFLGCTNYPHCNYKLNIGEDKFSKIRCPHCGFRMVLREGKYGPFLGCKGYPFCKFTYNFKRV